MAATIARARGYDTSRVKEVHRLGSQSAEVEAATWRTHAVAAVNRDGSGSLALDRNGKYLLRVEFGPEDAPDPAPGEDKLRIWVGGVEITPIRKHWGEGYEKAGEDWVSKMTGGLLTAREGGIAPAEPTYDSDGNAQ